MELGVARRLPQRRPARRISGWPSVLRVKVCDGGLGTAATIRCKDNGLPASCVYPGEANTPLLDSRPFACLRIQPWRTTCWTEGAVSWTAALTYGFTRRIFAEVSRKSTDTLTAPRQ